MTEKITGPHELQTIPPKALVQDLARRASGTSDRLRHLPIAGVELAVKLTPFAALRAPMAMTEAVLRRALLPNGGDESVDSGVYPGAREGQSDEAFTAPPDARLSVRSMVAELLDRSVRQSPRQAEEANFKRLLLQLVPDEARILHALSDGEPRAMEHIGFGSMGGTPDRMVLRYASPIGTQAGVRCPESVPDYLAHLVALDLVTVGAEDETLREQYEILDTYSEVEAAEEEAKADSLSEKLRLKTALRERHIIAISELGNKLWEAAHPDTHTFMVAEQRQDPEIDFDEDLPPEP
ncbi:Abi-alpha family protein [Antrihabitans cavernicola]|uniref:DUF4393 domain-containing protein n=1 Tax=Antrihabitans cavernicola TaxID=2495913 RepID=A0A5A7S5A3_9NOCA|nr:Abi-alpha family protein [Spelaeibacter cavernicola]KAA0017408.1 DUF4393 domain-containing protein [Spelaeibacter cavernicola]